VNRGATTTAVVASTAQPIVGAGVTYTATVTPAYTGPSTPSGTITFMDGATSIPGCAAQPLVGSRATCTVTYPATGSHAITAGYNSDANFTGSTSQPTTVTVVATPTATALAAPSPSPASTNQTITLTATVTPGIAGASQPTGTVAFLDGGAPISGCGAQPLTAGSSASSAACTVSYPAAGSHTITATYTGDANFAGSSSPPATVTVQGATAPGGGSGSPGPGIGSGTPHGLVLSRVAQSHNRWRERQGRPVRDARSVPVGTRFTFALSNPGRVTLAFIQILPGRRAGGRCLAPTKATHGARACRRTRTRGRLIQSAGAGTHHLGFDGRIGRTMLPSGDYTVTISAAGPSGGRSHTITLHFTIVG
jgi:hypothetical protein